MPLLCLGVEGCLLWVGYHLPILLDLCGQRRVVDASFLADEVEAAHRGPSHPTGVVDGVNCVLECLDEFNVALVFLLSAQVEVAVLVDHFHHAWFGVVLLVLMERVQRFQKLDAVLLGERVMPFQLRFELCAYLLSNVRPDEVKNMRACLFFPILFFLCPNLLPIQFIMATEPGVSASPSGVDGSSSSGSFLVRMALAAIGPAKPPNSFQT